MRPVRPSDQYAIHHPDGRWLYFLPRPGGEYHDSQRTAVLADGKPMTKLDLGHHHTVSWWATDHQAGEITAVYTTNPTVTGYTLNDGTMLCERFPATLTVDEWRSRTDDDEDRDLTTHYRYYSAVTEPRPDRTYTYPGPFAILDGCEPPHADGPGWVAELPSTLTERPEYAHCFPGYIPELDSHLTKIIKAMRHVQYCFTSKPGEAPGLRITVNVPFEQPVTKWTPDIGRGGRELKSGRKVQQTVSRSFVLAVPSRVHAATYAEALREWDEQVEHWTGIVRAAGARACNACMGHGHVIDRPDQPAAETESFPGELAILRSAISAIRASGDLDELHEIVDAYDRKTAEQPASN